MKQHLSTTIKNTSDLRKFLLSAMEDCVSGKLPPDSACSIARLSSQVLNSARLDLDVAQSVFRGEIDGTESASLISEEEPKSDNKDVLSIPEFKK